MAKLISLIQIISLTLHGVYRQIQKKHINQRYIVISDKCYIRLLVHKIDDIGNFTNTAQVGVVGRTCRSLPHIDKSQNILSYGTK